MRIMEKKMETTIVQGFYRVHMGIIGSPAVGFGA